MEAGRRIARIAGAPGVCYPSSAMDKESVCFADLWDLADQIGKGELSPVEVVEAHLQRIEALNPKLFAFLEVTADLARREAKTAEAEIAAGRHRGPLHGVPYGAKDIFDTAGIRTTHGSSFFRDRVPAADAESVARLKRAGAVLLGKCHTHEFAAAATTINPHYGTTRNPWNLERIAGGSSGGSAAAVAAGLCPAALGSDTGGSIRTPAAFCGVVGLKPTHGRVSLAGVCPNVLSFDHVGPITRTARDAALVLQAIAGYDPHDPMSRDVPLQNFSARFGAGICGARIALCPDFTGHAEVDHEVSAAFERAVGTLRELGAWVETVPFPHYDRIERTMTAVRGAEFAEFHRPFYTKNPDGYGADVRARVESALQVQLDDYVRALRERELLRREVEELFRRVDAIVLPSAPATAAPIATLMARVNGKDVACPWLHRPFLTPHNLTGCPAVSVPMGFSADRLPLSLQIVGRRGARRRFWGSPTPTKRPPRSFGRRGRPTPERDQGVRRHVVQRVIERVSPGLHRPRPGGDARVLRRSARLPGRLFIGNAGELQFLRQPSGRGLTEVYRCLTELARHTWGIWGIEGSPVSFGWVDQTATLSNEDASRKNAAFKTRHSSR